ncbi:hypothetical protein JCM5353_003260 [Sporobolomyces roseus]
MCDFNTTNLQGLFSSASQPAPQFQQIPFQNLSPSSNATSPPYSISSIAPASSSPSDYNYLVNATQPLSYPSQYLAPNSAASTYPTPSRHPSFSSGASPNYGQPLFVAEEDSSNSKRRRLTLAETAGLAPHSHPSLSSNSTTFTVKPDAFGHKSMPQPLLAPAPPPTKTQRQKSPVELIANAGIGRTGVYNPPTYHLLPKPVNVAAGANTNGKGKKTAPSATPASAAAEDKGGKRKKTADRGHNAVEQKYRNSINNALATLRDTIPALRHLKPLPSMPVSKRKASQFTLPSGIATSAPTGLVDGVAAAKTLSKGVILNKAIEYIDFLRFARESHNEDLDMLKEMVRTMVGGGDQLVVEFEKKREEREAERVQEREREQEEGEDGDDDGEGEEDGDEEDDDKPAPVVTKAKKAAPASKKRGAAKKDTSPPIKTKPLAPSAVPASTISLPSQQISPPLSSEYRHVQALNAAHLENIAASHQPQQHPITHTFPPSPVSSDDHSVSPAALMGDNSYYQPQQFTAQPPRVLLASFMGLSFAGGLGYDWTSGAAAAAEEASELVGSAWTSRLARRSLVDASQGSLIDMFHPSFLSGLVALGLASIVVSLAYVVYPLFFSASTSLPSDTRRSQALSSLASSSPSSTPTTYSAARATALAARKDLLNLIHAPSSISLLPSLAKETLVWAVRSGLGLRWTSTSRQSESQKDIETALAWVRIAEIETTVGCDIAYFSRLYTFLRLLNLSRSSSWPHITASTSIPAVTALLSTQLLNLGHSRLAETTWNSISSLRKKIDTSTSSTEQFIELALDADFATVKVVLDSHLRDDEDLAAPSDTVPLLLVAESTCSDALEDVWTRIFTTVVDTTCPPSLAGAVPSSEKIQSLLQEGDVQGTLDVVFESSVEGSEIRTFALMTRALLDTFSDTKEAGNRSITKSCIATLISEAREGGPFAHLASASPFCQLLLPSLPVDLMASFSPIDQASSDIDLLATTTLSWLVLRRQSLNLLVDRSAYPSPPPSPSSSPAPFDKVNRVVHAQALALRQLLAHDIFRQTEPSEGDENETVDLDEARDLLVDALSLLTRRAAGLGARDDDSGVEL